jgi:hypothetical protein
MAAQEEKLRAVRLELPENVHTLLRLEAAKQDTSLAALARRAVEDYLFKRKTRLPKGGESVPAWVETEPDGAFVPVLPRTAPPAKRQPKKAGAK